MSGHVPQLAELSVGDVVIEREVTLSRDSLVRYAGASGDFNPIHYRDDVATAVGLPGVLAHGMLTMGVAGSVVSEWIGAAGFVRDLQARFTKPVLVDPEAGATLQVTATVGAVDRDAGTARIDLRVVAAEQVVLGKSQAVVAFA